MNENERAKFELLLEGLNKKGWNTTCFVLKGEIEELLV